MVNNIGLGNLCDAKLYIDITNKVALGPDSKAD